MYPPQCHCCCCWHHCSPTVSAGRGNPFVQVDPSRGGRAKISQPYSTCALWAAVTLKGAELWGFGRASVGAVASQKGAGVNWLLLIASPQGLLL